MLFTGRVTADAEVREVKNNKKVTNFTVALNKRWKDKEGETHEKVAFVDCAYWTNSGVAEFLTKGVIVEITGWMEARAWANGNGEAKANLTCSVENIKLFGIPSGKPNGMESRPKENTPKGKQPEKASAGTGEDDLPF
jgi:single-strand DNA-binding protein